MKRIRAAAIAAILALLVTAGGAVADEPPDRADTPQPFEQAVVKFGVTTTVERVSVTDILMMDPQYAALHGVAMHDDDELDCWQARHRAQNTTHGLALRSTVWWCATTDDEPRVHHPIALGKVYDERGAHWRRLDRDHTISSGGVGETYVDTLIEAHWCYVPPQLTCRLEVWGEIETEQDAGGGASGDDNWRSKSHMD